MIEPKIGYWFAECCIEDLGRIDTEEQLARLRKRLSPDEMEDIGPPAGVWATLEEAEAALSAGER